jgi:hypothetical protein
MRSKEMQQAIDNVLARECQCVWCDDCGGSGRILIHGGGNWYEEFERCDMCHGGLVETCDRCRELDELYEDEL